MDIRKEYQRLKKQINEGDKTLVTKYKLAKIRDLVVLEDLLAALKVIVDIDESINIVNQIIAIQHRISCQPNYGKFNKHLREVKMLKSTSHKVYYAT